jgi:hypothetical protein
MDSGAGLAEGQPAAVRPHPDDAQCTGGHVAALAGMPWDWLHAPDALALARLPNCTRTDPFTNV